MKKMTMIFALLGSMAVSAQTAAEFCNSAQSYYDQGKYADAMTAVGRAVAKDPSASCREIRIKAALRETPTAEMYVQALTDLGYLVDHGDRSENTYRQVGIAEAGLAGELFKVRDYENAARHYKVAKEAYERAKKVSGDARYDDRIHDTETYIRQMEAESKY